MVFDKYLNNGFNIIFVYKNGIIESSKNKNMTISSKSFVKCRHMLNVKRGTTIFDKVVIVREDEKISNVYKLTTLDDGTNVNCYGVQIHDSIYCLPNGDIKTLNVSNKELIENSVSVDNYTIDNIYEIYSSQELYYKLIKILNGVNDELQGIFPKWRDVYYEIFDCLSESFLVYRFEPAKNITVVIDGVDCGGKQTMAERFKSVSSDTVKMYSEPNYCTPVGAVIKEILNTGRCKHVLQELMLLNRLYLYIDMIKNPNKIYLMDRYSVSNLLYNGVNEKSLYLYQLEMNYLPKISRLFLVYPRNDEEIKIHKSYLEKRRQSVGLDSNESDYRKQMKVVDMCEQTPCIKDALCKYVVGIATDENIETALKEYKNIVGINT